MFHVKPYFMKLFIIKILLSSIFFLFSLSCVAQDDGKISLGFSLDYGFGEDFNNKASALRFNYNLFENSRISPSFAYYLNKNSKRMISFELNYHYMFSDKLNAKIMPSMINQGIRFYTISGILISSISEINTKCSSCNTNEYYLASGYIYNFGFDFGIGVEYEIPTFLPLLRDIDVNFEIKYQIMDNYSRPLLSFGILYNLK